MIYEFYLDIYFLENLVLNYVILRMIAVLEKRRCSRIRCLITAAGGGGVMCLMMVFGIYKVQWQSGIWCMVVETAMAAASYSWCGWKKIMYRAVIFRLLSLLAEGSWQILRDYFRMPFPYSMAAGLLLPFFILQKIQKTNQKEQFYYPVTIKLHGKKKRITALWDSGNQLKQPVTGQPVHIIDADVLQTLLTEKEAEELQRFLDLEIVPCPSGMFSFIPYQSIGKKHGVLPVLKLDAIQVEKEKETVDTQEVLTAVSRYAVSNTGEYQMILHP